MLIKHLEYLAALAHERHFARAAAACHVTQPTLSAGLKQLEDSMGVLLVERGQRFQGLTAEGERVLVWARRILADCASLEQDVQAMHGELVGRLRVGAVPMALPAISLLTARFAARHPRVTISVLSHTSAEIQRGLEDFTLDVGITYLDGEPLPHRRTMPLYQERYLLLTPADGPLGGRDRVSWRDAASVPLCLLTPDMQGRRIIDGYFKRAEVAVHPSVETNSLITVCSHLRAGGWSSVMPHTILYLIGQLEGTRAIPLVDPAASETVGLIAPERTPLPPMTAALFDVLAGGEVGEIIAHRAAGTSP
ncbi:MAG: Transcriptional regulator Atu4705, LysR family [uncultured Gemmatimonadaceae bacterium]|uniref:Transcriptional regulator Atu4705, LysR family n=1 Tax=uncultured Gemmatimonadaceae bacterium TaxID=246130 RepID=A0A6J4MMG6_9BACT|nr:MAG: Transcriptional regulator Atu4705, LysR family [uncultured Gemmatimonadaceae bacterium]